jgi:hypothetical protein
MKHDPIVWFLRGATFIVWMVILFLLTSCNQESECDNIRRNIESLTAKESELKGLPTYNGSNNMDLVRIASQKAFLKHKLNGCEF